MGASRHEACITNRAEVFAMPAPDVMPSTIKRSPPKAQRTWAKTHDDAVREYGEGERAQAVVD
jgi:ChaB protein